ncbi:MAG: Crp/Fnr family transcriptional regulator, partial [Lactococcus hircilactis]
TSVNRIIHDLKAERVIDIIENKIMIYNLPYLENYVN